MDRKVLWICVCVWVANNHIVIGPHTHALWVMPDYDFYDFIMTIGQLTQTSVGYNNFLSMKKGLE